MAAEIDRQVIGGYELFPSHYLALEALGDAPELVDLSQVSSADRARFQARLKGAGRTAPLVAGPVCQPGA